jgi:hypothetical protein
MLLSFRLKTVAGFNEGEEQGEKQKPYPENDDVHRIFSLFSFVLPCSRQI